MYDKKQLLKNIFVILTIVALMKATGGAGFIIAVPFALMATPRNKPDALFFWILMCTSLMMANGHIVSKGTAFALSERVLLVLLGFFAAIQMLGHGTSPITKPFVLMYLYLFVMVFSSLQGWNPKVSLLKIFLFAMIYSAYFGAANFMARHNSLSALKRLRAVVLAVAIFFVLGSVALVPFPGISQMKGEEILFHPEMTSLFTGMTNHSQALGPLISSIGVLLFADWIFSVRRFDKLYLLLSLCCPYLIYLTSSRTGMGAYLLGMLFVVWVFANARDVYSKWKRRVMNAVMTVVFLLVAAFLLVPSLQAKVVRFALKWGGDETVTVEKVVQSRMGKFDSAIENFKKSPLIGNGFQVAESTTVHGTDSFMLSAPIEKGIWISAVLAEGGVVGFAIFCGFLLVAISTSIRNHAYITASCLVINTLTNLGEFTFFSMTYTGGFIWAMVFVGMAIDAQRLKEEGRLRRLELEMRMRQENWASAYA